jgi:hypothetical protein
MRETSVRNLPTTMLLATHSRHSWTKGKRHSLASDRLYRFPVRIRCHNVLGFRQLLPVLLDTTGLR